MFASSSSALVHCKRNKTYQFLVINRNINLWSVFILMHHLSHSPILIEYKLCGAVSPSPVYFLSSHNSFYSCELNRINITIKHLIIHISSELMITSGAGEIALLIDVYSRGDCLCKICSLSRDDIAMRFLCKQKRGKQLHCRSNVDFICQYIRKQDRF